MYRSLRHVAAFATLAVAASLSPTRAYAQPTVMTLACASGVGCGQLRFGITATAAPIVLETLQLTLSGGTWRFFEPLAPNQSTYSAEDGLGPLGGFTAISGAGSILNINFLDAGFPFELTTGQSGYVQVEGTNTSPGGLTVNYTGASTTGTISGVASFSNGNSSTVPEPSTVALMAAGVLAIGVAARRRKTAA